MKDWTCINIDFKNEHEKPLKTILSSSLYKEFKKYIEKNNMLYDISNIKFGSRLSRMNIKGISKGGC
jgi:hypothetical protein